MCGYIHTHTSMTYIAQTRNHKYIQHTMHKLTQLDRHISHTCTDTRTFYMLYLFGVAFRSTDTWNKHGGETKHYSLLLCILLTGRWECTVNLGYIVPVSEVNYPLYSEQGQHGTFVITY